MDCFTCSLDGEPLPDNIFWVGAINPLSVPGSARVTAAQTSANQFTGVEDAMDSQDYIVYSLPPCALHLVREVGDFGRDERQDFIDAYLKASLRVFGVVAVAPPFRLSILLLTNRNISCCLLPSYVYQDSNFALAQSLRSMLQDDDIDMMAVAAELISFSHTFVENAKAFAALRYHCLFRAPWVSISAPIAASRRCIASSHPFETSSGARSCLTFCCVSRTGTSSPPGTPATRTSPCHLTSPWRGERSCRP